MVYVKHPEHGNRHINTEDVAEHVAKGWVVWPRSAEQKAGIAAPTVFVSAFTSEPIKRGPGRPKKVAK